MATRVCRVVSLICIRGNREHPLLTFIVSAYVIVNLLSLTQCTFDSFFVNCSGFGPRWLIFSVRVSKSSVVIMATALKFPDPFYFSVPNLAFEWSQWRCQFDWYILATRKDEKDEEIIEVCFYRCWAEKVSRFMNL